MSDTRMYLTDATRQLQKPDDAQPPPVPLKIGQPSHVAEGKYVAVSPSGAHVPIPKELFIALLDFMKTRKCPGSITIEFRGGNITSVEAVAKKTYRGSPPPD